MRAISTSKWNGLAITVSAPHLYAWTAIVADHPHQLDATGARHPELGEDQVDVHAVQLGHRGVCVVRRRHSVAAVGNAPCQHTEISAVRLHNEDARRLPTRVATIAFPDRGVHYPELRANG